MTEEQAEKFLKSLSTYVNAKIQTWSNYDQRTAANLERSEKNLKEALLQIPAADIKNHSSSFFPLFNSASGHELPPGFWLLKP